MTQNRYDHTWKGVRILSRYNTFDRYIACMLIVLGFLCIFQAGAKVMLWFAGSRASGYISNVATQVSKTGAVWTHYAFQTASMEEYSGSAMVAGNTRIALNQEIIVAYLKQAPAINMPAYGGYAAIIGAGWMMAGLFLAGLGLVLQKKN